MTIRVLRLLPGFLLLAGCATSTSPNANDAAPVVAALARDFMAAASSGNVEGMMTTYAADAVLMPPNAPPQRGAAAIRQFWGGFLGVGKVDLKLTDESVVQSCDMATEMGHYDVTITPKGAAPVTTTASTS